MTDKEFNKCTEERPCTPCFINEGECLDPTSSWQEDKCAWPVSKEAAKDLATLFDPNAFEKGRCTFSRVTFWQFCRAMMRQCGISQAARDTPANHRREGIDDGRTEPDAEEDAYVIDRLGKLLAGVAIALKGPELPLHRHGYQDLPELARMLMLEVEFYRAGMGRDSVIEACAAICQRRAAEALSNPAIHADSRTAVHTSLICAAVEIAAIESQRSGNGE